MGFGRFVVGVFLGLLFLANTGCYYLAQATDGDKVKTKDGPQWWLYLAIAAAVAAASGVSAALNATKDDPDRRQTGLAIAAGGAVVAFVCMG